MALQDLTPQLRTRLSRLERVVGVFVAFAALLLVAGLGFYIRQRAQSKGWFDQKMPYFTFVRTAAGLKVGDPVMLMGFAVGEITTIEAQPPEDSYYNVFVAFYVKEPHQGYLWEDSRARVGASDFLGKRFIELTKGTNGTPTYLFHPIKEVTLEDAALLNETNQLFFAEDIFQNKTNLLVSVNAPFHKDILTTNLIPAGSVTSLRLYDKAVRTKKPTGLWDFENSYYRDPGENEKTKKGYFLNPVEAPALTERLEEVVNLVESAIPNVLALTNQLQRVLDSAVTATSHADELLSGARPIVANLTQITENIREPEGSLGKWLIPPDLSLQLTQALASANTILTNSDAQITTLATGLDAAIENLANITGNLHAQVNANTNIVGEVSKLIIDTDDMVQGLKRHWLLRSAFKSKAPPPSTPTRTPARSPKDGGR
jgi:ABC-type transporter Mla subunit MlaD